MVVVVILYILSFYCRCHFTHHPPLSLSYHLILIQYNLPSTSSLYTQNLLMTLSLYTPYLHIVLWKLHSTVLMFCRYVQYRCVYNIHSTDTLSLSLHALCTMHSLPGLMMPYFCYHCIRPRSSTLLYLKP